MKKHLNLSVALNLCLFLVASPLLATATGAKSARPISRTIIKARTGVRKSNKRIGAVVRPSMQKPALVAGQTGTLLPDGRWLMIGGEGSDGTLATIGIKSPNSDEVALVASQLQYARAWHSATMLPDGKVLIFGGVGDNGQVIGVAEVFDPETQRLESLSSIALTPRSHHTATVLTDGRVMFAGGVSEKGRPSGKVELWETRTDAVVALPARLQTARRKHTATLLPNGNVLLWGGNDKDGKGLENGDLYDPETGSFTWVGAHVEQDEKDAPRLDASLPKDGDGDVPLESRIALRFSKPLRVETVNGNTVTLSGAHGAVAVKVVPAEGGLLAFITPQERLHSDTAYTLTVNGSTDRNNLALPFTTVSFKTVNTEPEVKEPEKEQSPVTQAFSDDEWIPDARNLRGDWRSGRPDSPAKSMPPLEAAQGVTALAGQVLALSGRPLANVTLRIGHQTAVTDNTGRFLLTGLPQGTHGLTILGETASTPGKTYGTFDVKVDVAQGKTTVLPYTIWLPILDNQNAVRLSTPTTREVVVTTPRIPGMEVRVPSNAVLRMPKGMHHMQGSMHKDQLLDTLAITPMPVDRPPFPLPTGVQQGLLFTLQLHGAKVQGMNGEKRPGLRIIFPNYLGLPAGERVAFWNYDSTGVGWYLYGQGTVTPDRKQVVPDPGVELESMHCASLMTTIADLAFGFPRPGGAVMVGDPVDMGSGLFVYNKTDLLLPDTLPIAINRTYRQNDPADRAFGKGASFPYEMFIYGDTASYGEMILPDGGRIRFNWNAAAGLYEHTETPTIFYKATLKTVASPHADYDGGWEVKLQDGSIYLFFRKTLHGDALGIHKSATGLHSIQDRYGNKVVINRDSGRRATKITSPNGKWIELTYDGASTRIAQAKDNIGRVVSYTYDASGRLWKVTDANLGVTEYTYDTSHRMVTIKDARGIVYLTNEYDPASGRVTKQTQADNTTFLFAYTVDANGKITQTDVTNPRGRVRRVTFNSSGYSVSDISAVGTPEQQSITIERLAGSNLVERVINPLGHRTKYTYDARGNVETVTTMEGTTAATTTTFTYEPLYNQVATVKDPLNHTTTYAYTNGVLNSITDPLSHQTSVTFNANGQLTSVTNALQHKTRFEYESGDLVKVIDPLNRSVTRYTDAAGRPTRITDPLGRVTRYEYDNLNLLKKVIDPLQGETAFTYDENGRLKSVTDARSKVTSYTYNNMDRVETRTDPLLKVEQYDYDENGNLKKYTDRRGKVTTMRYDALDRASFTGFGTVGEGESATYESTINYTYDALSRLKTVVDSQAGTITKSYDDLARTMSETTPQGSVSYSADVAGRLASMTAGGQTTVNYGYDDANRLTNITQGAASVIIGYDNANRRERLTLPNGMVTEYGYDAASQLTSLIYKNGTTTLGNLTYAYDNGGRRTSMGGSYARMIAPEQLPVTTYNDANQLTQRGAVTFTYDDNGNLVSDGANTYTWNARNQLASISGSVTASFQYDGFGRRVSKTVNGVTTGYLYDGGNIVQEQGADSNINLLNGGLDEVFSRSEQAGAWSPLTDGLGSTLALGDSTGTIQSEYTYGAFGTTATTGINSNNASQYTGRENDATGLYYYRNRYYSPTLQRFISQDPIGFGGGINLYAYVGNNPINWVDPLGLDRSNPLWDGLQFLLDLGGMIPLVGEPLDLLNAGISYVRGNYSDAALSAAGAFPFLGIGATIGKWGKKVAIHMDEAVELGAKHVDGAGDMITSSSKGFQFINTTVDASGNSITRISRFDINPASKHVQREGPHLNLETQINGVPIKSGPLADPHIPINPGTVRPGDIP